MDTPEKPPAPWWGLALSPRTVLAYYTDPPPLDQVEVHWVRLHRDAAVLELLVELPRFPDKPSPRWSNGSNTAQAELRFVDVREVALSGWGTTNVGRLSLTPEAGGVRFGFDGPTVRLRGLAGWFDVTRVSGYIKEGD